MDRVLVSGFNSNSFVEALCVENVSTVENVDKWIRADVLVIVENGSNADALIVAKIDSWDENGSLLEISCERIRDDI